MAIVKSLRTDVIPRKAALATAGIMAVTAVVLLGMGRVPWCACGHIALWSGDIWSSENSQQIADPYTFTHITHGLIFYWTLTYLVTKVRGATLSTGFLLVVAVFIESSWEILENSPMIIDRYREVTISLDYYGDSVINSIADIAACIAGFLLASRLSLAATLMMIFLLEAVLTFLQPWDRRNRSNPVRNSVSSSTNRIPRSFIF